jgi:hypothetical protein
MGCWVGSDKNLGVGLLPLDSSLKGFEILERLSKTSYLIDIN